MLELTVGYTEPLFATVAPADAINKNATWRSNAPTIASVDGNGKVTALAEGSATITVTTTDGGKTDACDVTIAGVTINGIVWAMRNVDTSGTFTPKAEDYGIFCQWNRKTAWPATGDVTDWDSSTPTGGSWTTINDPCPAGWCVPTKAEQDKLFETGVTNVWTAQNGVNGRKFTGTSTYKSIFFPAAGYRDYADGTPNSGGSLGGYWSSSYYSNDYAWGMDFGSPGTGHDGGNRFYGFTVRCVLQ